MKTDAVFFGLQQLKETELYGPKTFIAQQGLPAYNQPNRLR